MTFINPTADIREVDTMHISMIAVSSGGVLGKGLGYERYKVDLTIFLNTKQTLFLRHLQKSGVLLGLCIIILSFCIVLWRLVLHASRGASNFETLFCVGYALLLFGHMVVNIGMNIGVLPVTGIPLPFMSYGGSHILGECGLGVVLSMARFERAIHPDDIHNEFHGYA